MDPELMEVIGLRWFKYKVSVSSTIRQQNVIKTAMGQKCRFIRRARPTKEDQGMGD